MFTKEIGIDLGTANTLVFVKGKGIIIREPSVVAVDVKTGTVKSVGQRAKEVVGRTPGSIVTVRPLKDGVIADFEVTTCMLQEFIARAMNKSFLNKAKVVICIPSGVTAVERRAVKESAEQAGAKKVMIVEEPMAAAIGAGLPVAEPEGSIVVDIGGGTTEVAVISLGGIVAAKSVRVGGDKFDNDIINSIKKRYNLLIGERTAEAVKIAVGNAFPLDEEITTNIKGRNLLTGLPENMQVTSSEIREALKDSLQEMIEAVRITLEKTPPELAADIIDTGIVLTGGGALLRGMDKLLAQETGMTVRVADEPLDCVALGTGEILENMDKLSSVFSDGDIRY